jgi:hypothetical protein
MAWNVVFPLYSCGTQGHTIFNTIASVSDRPAKLHSQSAGVFLLAKVLSGLIRRAAIHPVF